MTYRHINAARLLFASASVSLFVMAALSIQPAYAEDMGTTEPALDVSANIGVVSDYRFRGISLSDRDPAVQGGVDLTTRAGWFVGTWASSIAKYGGTNAELDLYAGFANEFAGLDVSASANAYVYPGGHGVNYVELQSSIGKSFGAVRIATEFFYVPDQKNTLTDNIYIGASLSAPIGGTPLQVKVRGGYEVGFYDSKWDWEAGIACERDWGSASLSAVGSNYGGPLEADRLGKAGIMAGLIFNF
jgi:uncharacterized protein (TIGR02001 family)